MANRRWTSNEQLKISDTASRLSPGVGGVNRQAIAEKTKNWPGAPGPKGQGYDPHRLGFTEIKIHVKQDMPDDSSAMGAMRGHGRMDATEEAAMMPDLKKSRRKSKIPIGMGQSRGKGLLTRT